jgi:hypothetical protein
MVRHPSHAIPGLAAVAFALLASGCSDSAETQCVRSGIAKICYVRDNAAQGTLDVSGLQPGSTLTVKSEKFGESSYPVNDAGTVDGLVGVINSTGTSVELTVTGTTGSKELLVGTFKS